MAATEAVGKNCRVAVIEKNSQCGRKMLITGKGRCNITNSRKWDEFKEHIHPDSGFFRPSFMAFSNSDTVSLLNRGYFRFPAGVRTYAIHLCHISVSPEMWTCVAIQKSCRYPAVRTDLMLRYLDSRIK